MEQKNNETSGLSQGTLTNSNEVEHQRGVGPCGEAASEKILVFVVAGMIFIATQDLGISWNGVTSTNLRKLT